MKSHEVTANRYINILIGRQRYTSNLLVALSSGLSPFPTLLGSSGETLSETSDVEREVERGVESVIVDVFLCAVLAKPICNCRLAILTAGATTGARQLLLS